MSVINKMLRDLDERNAPPAETTVLTQKLRSVPERPKATRLVLPVIAGIAVLAATAYWLVLRPMIQAKKPKSPTTITLEPTAPPNVNMAKVDQAAAPTTANVAPPATATPNPAAAPDPAVAAVPTAMPAQPSLPVAPAESGRNAVAAAPSVTRSNNDPATKETAMRDNRLRRTNRGEPVTIASIAPAPKAPPVEERARSTTPSVSASIDPGTSASPSIEKQPRTTGRSGAESEFHKAAVLLNQGRVEESIEGLRRALSLDPKLLVARQTIVALLIERGQTAEAKGVVAQGLEADPTNSGQAMLLARITLDGGDQAGALEVLKRYASAGAMNPEYLGFAAALNHRAGNYRDAIDGFAAAAQLAPHHGPFWVGLAVAQQAIGRKTEATDAFQRAKASGTLGPELVAIVDQNLRKLQ